MKKNKKQRQRKQDARQRQRQRKRAPKDRGFGFLALFDVDNKILGFLECIEMARHTVDALGLKGKRFIFNLKAGDEEKLHGITNLYYFRKYEDLFGVSTDADCIAYCIENFPGGHFQLGDIAHDDIDSPEFWKKSPFEKIARTMDDRGFRYEWALEAFERLLDDDCSRIMLL